MSTNDKLDVIETRHAAASPGQWRTWSDGHVGSPKHHIGGIVMPTPGSDEAQRMPDAEFIAHAHQDVPTLVNALRAVLAVCDRRDAKPVDGARTVPTATIRAAIEEALGD